MSYSVHVFRREIQAKVEAHGLGAVLENDSLRPSFDAATLEGLGENLEMRGFASVRSDEHGRHFTHEGWGAEALLSSTGLYLTASGEGIFEILMVGSELADDELVKYDPQEGSWE